MICATMGALAIPMAYLTVRLAGYTRATSVTAALMICYGKQLVVCKSLQLPLSEHSALQKIATLLSVDSSTWTACFYASLRLLP